MVVSSLRIERFLTNFQQAGIPLAYIFAETPEEREELAKTLKPLAEQHKGKINFATIDAKAFGAHAGNLNLEVGKWPAFAIQDTVKNTKFPFDQEKKLTEKDVGKFVSDYVEGKVEPSIKSEPIPEKQDGPVSIVVAHNYKDIVLDDSKDVLIEFYAPWCGHCKALAPKYDELGQQYAPYSDKIVIAKVDATANDVPDEIGGFPTIKLYPAGAKDSPVDYSGPRTVEDLAKFIKESGKYKIDAYEDAKPSESEAAESASETVGSQAPAATESASEGVAGKVKSVASEAAEAVKTAVADSDDGGAQDHDEL